MAASFRAQKGELRLPPVRCSAGGPLCQCFKAGLCRPPVRSSAHGGLFQTPLWQQLMRYTASMCTDLEADHFVLNVLSGGLFQSSIGLQSTS